MGWCLSACHRKAAQSKMLRGAGTGVHIQMLRVSCFPHICCSMGSASGLWWCTAEHENNKTQGQNDPKHFTAGKVAAGPPGVLPHACCW